jgi:hypothetical protein
MSFVQKAGILNNFKILGICYGQIIHCPQSGPGLGKRRAVSALHEVKYSVTVGLLLLQNYSKIRKALQVKLSIFSKGF